MKTFLAKRKLFLTILLASIVLMAMSAEFVITKGIEFILNHSIASMTGKKFLFNGLHREKGRWVVDKLQLCSECSENVYFQSKAKVHYAIDIMKMEVDLYLTLEQPELKIQFPLTDFSSWLKNFENQVKRGFSGTNHFAIQQGRVYLGEHVYEVNADAFVGSSLEGHFHINFSDSTSSSVDNCLLMHLTRDLSSTWQLDVQYQKVDCIHLQRVACYLFPQLQDWKVTGGTLHGTGSLIFQDPQRPFVDGEFELRHLSFEHIPSELQGVLPEVIFHFKKGKGGSVIFSGNDRIWWGTGEIKNIEGGIFVDDQSQAKIALHGIYSYPNLSCSLSVGGQAQFFADEEVLPSSLYKDGFQAHLAMNMELLDDDHRAEQWGKLQGFLDIDSKKNSAIQFSLNGKMNYFLHHIPHEKLRDNLWEAFNQHELFVSAALHEEIQEILGLAKIVDEKGCEKWMQFGFKNEGWFHIKDLPLEKYVVPFFIEEKSIKMTGFGDFKGKFDRQRLQVAYEAHNVHIENDVLDIFIEEIEQDPALLSSGSVHEIQFADGKQTGSLSLINASYLEKNSGLTFTNVNAQVDFEGSRVHIPSIESFCNGIYLSGAMEMDFSKLNQGYYDIDIRPQALHGQVSQVQTFFAHFPNPFFFLKIPLEGEITLHQDVSHMHFAFTPDNVSMQMHLKGALTDGVIRAQDSQVALHELSFNFEYDHAANVLNFSEIQGTLLVGEPERVEEYNVIGEKIHFSDYAHNKSSFDVWIGDKKRDFIRVVGETYASNRLLGSNSVQFVLDNHLSHFGNLYPRTFHLILRDWWQIQEFHLEADFKLADLFQDLKRFSRTGFLCLSRNCLKQLHDIKRAEGSFTVNIEYNEPCSELDYHVSGRDVVIDSYNFENMILDGKKSGEAWIIDQLLMDQISIAADILRKPGSWLINFLGIKWGSAILMGLQGEYFDDSRQAEGKINLLEIDIHALNAWPKFHNFLLKFPLKGHLRASGPFRYECMNGFSGKLDTSLNVSFKNGEFNGLFFNDVQNVSLKFSSDKNLVIENIDSGLKTQLEGPEKAALRLEKFEYDLKQDVFSLENLGFVISSSDLAEVLHLLSGHFPLMVYPAITEMIKYSKQNKSWEGNLSFEYADPHYAVKFALKDYICPLLNNKISLSNFVFEYDPCEIKMTAQCHGWVIPFWMQYKSTCPRLSRGELVITEESPEHIPLNPLIAKLQYHPEQGFSIDQVLGQFRSLNFALLKDLSKTPIEGTHFLQGSIQFNAQDAIALVSPELAEKLSDLQIGSGYCLNGQCELQANHASKGLFKVYFSGDLQGVNFEFKGYQFERLHAALKWMPEQAVLSHMEMSDSSGNLQIGELRVDKLGKEIWQMTLSNAEAKDFRPSLMQKVGIPQSLDPKPLAFRKFVLENLQGNLGDSNSFVGKGSLAFVNPPKTNTNYSLFSIPGEILNQLGLDLSILNPVVGTVFFEVMNNKIFLTKLKDVYSQGKMSKFYLPSNAQPSYIDFEGNLHLQIKMKQYNLFFKLAELFLVNVQGTWQRPIYTLQKAGDRK